MNNKISTIVLLAGLSLGSSATSALAQVAPPPKPAEKPTQADPVPEATPQETAPAAKDRNGAPSGIGEVPNIPHPPLAMKGEDGRIVRLQQLPDILALRSNPLVGPKSVDAIMPVIYGRRARFEMLTINNIDLYWELTDGALESLTLGDMKRMNEIAEMVKPMVGKTTLSEELTNRGILTRVQGKMNQNIVADYKKAVGDEIQVLDGDDSLDEYLKFILNDSFLEARLAYRALIAELVGQVDAVIAKAEIDSPIASELLALQSPLSAVSDQASDQIDAFDKIFRTLSVEDAIKVLDTMRQMRANPNVSPTIMKIDVLREGKSVLNNDLGFEMKRKGKVVRSNLKEDKENEQSAQED